MGNGHCIANLSDESETKPLLVVKKGEESGSITAIINRQLQVFQWKSDAQHRPNILESTAPPDTNDGWHCVAAPPPTSSLTPSVP
ncbi:hypothetical protein E2C01_020595 [Portunus trituberculatus]|uniref:Uncharacterized protein n=1 Tax=Portunus trituberculatus TaxID=210409 RepID=A0A5B7E2R0_PORTR|nr:hypothetical protein [Portunus trituberculatus]